MKLKMLVSYAGRDFSLAPGEETDRFSEAEAKRLIKAEHAVKAPPPVVKKPASKAEWDEEREALLAERDGLAAQLAEANERLGRLTAQAAAFNTFAASLTSAVAALPMAAAYAGQEAIFAKAEIVRALGMRRALVARQIGDRRAGLEASARTQLTASRYTGLVKFARMFMQSLSLGVGAWLAIHAEISVGAIIAASVLLARALQPIEQMVQAWPAIGQALGAQFAGLEGLYGEFGPDDFAVLGFPCDQFAHQEFDDADEIGSFCTQNYGVTFPMFAKVDVNGDDADPLFAWLRSEKGGILGDAIKWNFTKFLVGRDGQVIRRYAPTTEPEKLRDDIRRALDTE